MEDLIAIIIIGLLVILFFYFGYKDDFNRNPTSFFKTIVGVSIGFISTSLGLPGISTWMKEWMKEDRESKKL